MGAFALGVLCFRPLSGYVTDQKSRKLSLIIGVSIFFIVPVFYLFSSSFLYLVIIRFVHGLGITFYSTANPAFITDLVPEENRGKVLGNMATASTLSFTFGPLIGISVLTGFGFLYLIYLCIIIGFFNLFVVSFLTEQRWKSVEKQKISYKNVVFKRSILVLSFIQLVNAIIFGGIVTFLPVLLEKTSDLNIGPFFVIESIVVILCRIFASHLSDRYGRGPVFFYSFMILLAAVFLISQINGFILLIIVAVLFGMGAALCNPTLAAFVADETDQRALGTVFGFFYGAFDAGVLLAGMILGLVADITSLNDMFILTSLFGFFCLVVFVVSIKNNIIFSIKWVLTGSSH